MAKRRRRARPDRTFRLSGIIFTTAGLLMLLGAGVTWRMATSFLDSAVATDARIVDYEVDTSTDSDGHTSTTYPMTVEFRVANGEIMRGSPEDSSSEQPQVGDTLPILYDPAHPTKKIVTDSWFGKWGPPAILGFLGTTFTLIGGGFAWRVWGPRQRRRRRTRATGTQVRATVTSVYQDETLRVSGQYGYFIVLEGPHPRTGAPREYRSERLWFDPGDVVAVGDELDVKVDPARPDDHWVDTSSLEARLNAA